jgi:hypothetical protein
LIEEKIPRRAQFQSDPVIHNLKVLKMIQKTRTSRKDPIHNLKNPSIQQASHNPKEFLCNNKNPININF